jgi:hypothetical protein
MVHDLDKILSQLEEAIERLKIRYEHYFMGLERFAPVKERRAAERTIRSLRGQLMSNTAHKFKLRMLIQRFTTYKTHWNRIQREIDEGRHRRDLAKIQRDLKKRGVDAKGLLKARTASEVEAALMKYIKQAKANDERTAAAEQREVNSLLPSSPASPAAKDATAQPEAAQPRGSHPPPLPIEALGPKSKGGNGKSQDPASKERLKNLYTAYIDARKKTGQPVKGVTYEKMVHSINKQLPSIKKKHGSNNVDFCVVVKKGKAILKAVPKK